jgi:DNA-binding NarL/FixJ family response regulator
MTPIRVLLADDHTLVRAGLRSLLARAEGVEIVGEAADGREAVELAAANRPDVVLMDLLMPGLGGLEATAEITAKVPTARVIVVSMNDTEDYVLQSLRAGAAGYLLKDGSPSELEQAVRTVAAGGRYLSPAVSRHLISGLTRTPAPASADPLTPRQREVLRLVAEGLSTKQIARQLGISPKTVEAHRSQLMNALDIHDIAGLVRYAIRIGLVKPE